MFFLVCSNTISDSDLQIVSSESTALEAYSHLTSKRTRKQNRTKQISRLSLIGGDIFAEVLLLGARWVHQVNISSKYIKEDQHLPSTIL